VGATGDQYLASGQGAGSGYQIDAMLMQLPALNRLLHKLHAAGFRRFHQLTHDAVGVDEMPGVREKQSALNLFAELRRGLAYRSGLPPIDWHLLLLHASLQCFECRA